MAPEPWLPPDEPLAAVETTQVGRLPLRLPVHVGRAVSLRSAASVMRSEGISSLVVDTEPPSFVTERDLVQAVADGRDLEAPVTTVATRGPVWIPPTVTVEHAAAVMLGLGIRHLLVLDSTGRVVGVLSIRDAFEVLLRVADADRWVSAFRAALGDVG